MRESKDSLDTFRTKGYWVARGQLGAEKLVSLNDEIEAFQKNRYSIPWIDNSMDYPTSLNAVHFPHRVSEAIYHIAIDSTLTSWAAIFAGAHLLDWDEQICLIQSMLYVKGAGKKGQPWHQDERITPTRDRSLVTAWVAIDAATESNGCLWVVPGTHRKGQLFSTDEVDDHPEWVKSDVIQVDPSKSTPLILQPGDVAFLSGYLVHGSYRNQSSGTRKSLVLNYQSIWSPLLTEAMCEHGSPIDVSYSSTAKAIDVNNPPAFERYAAAVLAR